MKQNWEKYRRRVIGIGLLVFLVHREKLSGYMVGIDTEDLIRLGRDFYAGWLDTGRQGLVLLKALTGGLTFNPYFAGMMTLLFLALAVSAFLFLWESSSGIKKSGSSGTKDGAAAGTAGVLWAAGALLWVTHPVLTEQLYFSLQGAEICLGMLLTTLALFLVRRWRRRRKKWLLPCSFLLLMLVFSTYQAFVVFYIFGAASLLLLEGLSGYADVEKAPLSGRRLFAGALPYIGVFLAAFSVNMLATGLFFSRSDYLSEQIQWGQVPAAKNFRAIAGHVVKTWTGYDSVHYHFSYGILSVAAIVLVTRLLVRRRREERGKGAAAVLILFFLFLLSVPYLMTVLCGGPPVVRSQLVLPVSSAFLSWLDGYLCRLLWADGRSVKDEHSGENGRSSQRTGAAVCAALGLACLAGVWGQAQTTEALYYTERARYEQDAAIGRELILQMDRIDPDRSLPVAVIGSRPFSGSNACLAGEVMGHSFFDYDTEVEPQFYWSARRILGFLHTLGADYPQAGMERMEEALEYGARMPVWPQEGCVEEYNGMILVHF